MKKLLTSVTLFCAASSYGATATWVGSASDTDLNTATNWSGSIAPVTGDNLLFSSTAFGTTLTDTLATSFTATNITFDASAPAYVFSGNNINISGGITLNSAVTQTFNNSLTVASGASATYSGVSGSTLSLQGDSIVNGTLTLSGPAAFSMRNLTSSSTSAALNLTSGANVTISGQSYTNQFNGTISIGSGATLTDQASAPSYEGFGTGAVMLVSGGTYAIGASTAHLASNTTLSNGGVVTASTALTVGTNTTVTGSGAGGTVTLANNLALNSTYTLTFTGPVTATLGSGITGAGSLVVGSGATVNTGTATYLNNYTGAITVATGGILNNNNGTAGINSYPGFAATMTVQGAYNLTGAGSRLAQTTILDGGTITSSASTNINSATSITGTVNGGTVTLGFGILGAGALTVGSGANVSISGPPRIPTATRVRSPWPPEAR